MNIQEAIEHIPPNEKDREKLRSELALHINELLVRDFNQLVQLLYQVDVAEKKLKEVLQNNPDQDAGILIADLLLKRQEEKQAFRRSNPPANNIADDERW